MEKNKSTVFDLDVENIPDDWGIVSLKAIDLGGKENIDPRAYPGDDFEYYSIPAYQEGGKPVIEKGKNILSQKIIVQNDSVLFGKLNPRVEKVWHVQSETGYKKIASTEFIPIYPDQEKIFPRYLYYVEWSKFVMPKAKTLVTGSTPSRQRVDPTSFFKIKIPLPSRTEQVRIAFILSKLQQAIAQQEQIIMKTKELKRSLMHRLFTCGLRGDELKETVIGTVPISWNKKDLEQVADIVYGAQAAVAHALDSSIGTPIFTNINITNEGQIDLTTLRYYKVPEKKRDRLMLKKGDILFNWRSGSKEHVGKTALFELDGEYTFSSFILRFRASKDIHNRFLVYYLYYLKSIGYFSQYRDQSSVNSVFNASASAKIPVFVPEMDEQKEIAASLNSIDRKIGVEKCRSNSINALFRTMLNNLMTGQIRVKAIDFGEINV